MPVPLPRLGGPSLDFISFAAGSDGTPLSGTTAHTKDAWSTLIAATTHDTAWLLIQAYQDAFANDQFLFDIGVGAAASEVLIIPDLYCGNTNVAAPHMFTYVVPVNIPAGSRIAGRCQATNGGSGSMNLTVQAIAPGAAGIGGLGRHEAWGVSTGSTGLTTCSVGGTAHTDSAWAQLIASSAFDVRWLNVCIAHEKNTAASACSWLVDLAVGGSGSEIVIVNDLLAVAGTANDSAVTTIAFPFAIPAGSRVSARARCSITTATDRNIMVGVWGSG